MTGRAGFYELLERDPEAALRDVTARRRLHRVRAHNGVVTALFDCAACGVLDKQLERAERAASKGGA